MIVGLGVKGTFAALPCVIRASGSAFLLALPWLMFAELLAGGTHTSQMEQAVSSCGILPLAQCLAKSAAARTPMSHSLLQEFAACISLLRTVGCRLSGINPCM